MNPWRNVALLAFGQALLLTQGVSLVAVSGLAGRMLATHPALATLPLTTYVLGSAATTLPAAFFMRRRGRRAGFMLGAAAGGIGALVCATAVAGGGFWLLCLGTALCGIYNAVGQQYRFAAADAVTTNGQSRAISLTLAGGILGGIFGPWASTLTRGLLAPAYLGTYLSLAALALVAIAGASRLDIPPLSSAERQRAGRPYAVILRQPAYLLAVLAAAASYGIMNLLMTATPLAMDICRHPYADTALVLEWHVIGMFAPAFFTGELIRRLGAPTVIGSGCAFMLACLAIALGGVSLLHFWWALLLLGIGWNFMFIGGTSLLAEDCQPEERAKIQGSNDFIVFAVQALTSLAAGLLINSRGWEMLSWLALPAVLLTGVATLAYAARNRYR